MGVGQDAGEKFPARRVTPGAEKCSPSGHRWASLHGLTTVATSRRILGRIDHEVCDRSGLASLVSGEALVEGGLELGVAGDLDAGAGDADEAALAQCGEGAGEGLGGDTEL